VDQRYATLVRKRAAGSLRVRTAGRDAAMHPAPEGYPLRQQSRRCRSQSTQLPLEGVRRPTLAFDNRRMSAPVHRCGHAPRPKSHVGSRLSLPAPNRRLEPPGHWPHFVRLPLPLRGWGAPSGGSGPLGRFRVAGPRLGHWPAGRIPADVDSPAGEPGRQPGVLALLADRQR
jgi:hypothetical protein